MKRIYFEFNVALKFRVNYDKFIDIYFEENDVKFHITANERRFNECLLR